MQVAEETVFPTAEREECHGRGDSDVDTDVADLRFIAKLAGGGAAVGEKARHVTIAAAIDKRDGIVNRLNVNEP